jgi:hypothetical protein
MRVAIFAGPTLVGHHKRDDGFDWLPPAAEGDVYRAAREKVDAIGLIDGRFETVPSVWHKEILWALSRGIRVFGSASMGALRAAELADFGMIGTGAIYRDFRAGVLTDDDEVAVLHAPQELGYRPLTEAMVDMRATIRKAEQEKIISRHCAAALIRIAKTMFFKQRTWDLLLKRAAVARLPGKQLARFACWLPANKVDQKRIDALAMLKTMRRLLGAQSAPLQPGFRFQHTEFWQSLMDRHLQQ